MIIVITGVQRSGLCLADAGDRLILAVPAGSGFSLMVAVGLLCVYVRSTTKRMNVEERRCFKKGGKTGREFFFRRIC